MKKYILITGLIALILLSGLQIGRYKENVENRKVNAMISGRENKKEKTEPVKSAKKTNKYRNVAYFTSWSIYERGVFVEDIDAALLTHINFAFANLNANGSIAVGDSWADLEKPMGSQNSETKGLKGNFGQLKQLKKKYPHLKTLISVGGWTWSGNFSDVAASSAKRKKFAKSAVQFITKYGFDGIDIDWEYPVEGGNNIKHRKEDKKNYTLLLKETRKALNEQGKKDGKKYLLTIACGANDSFIKNTELKKMMKYLDFINVMTYDYHGAWESKTNHNAPLYSDSPFCVSHTIEAYLKAGVKPEDMNLGLAFYGRGWVNVASKKNKGLLQSASVATQKGFGFGTWEAGAFDYWDLEKNYINKKGYKRYFDKEARVPYLFNGNTFISYDDAESIGEKLDFMIEKKLGGVMFWEFSGDKKKTLQKVITKKLGLNGGSVKKVAADDKKQQKTENDTTREAPKWDKDTVYLKGDTVTYNNKVYRAKWWTQGEKPGTGGEWGPWEEV